MLRVFGAIAVATIWLGFVLGSTTAAIAPECTCGSLESQVDQADAVFVGRVRDVSVEAEGPAGREVLWNIEVERSVVGPAADVIAVSGGGELSNCRAELEPGQRYVIVAFWRSGHLATSQCGVAAPEALEALMAPPDTGVNRSVLAVAVAVSLAGGVVVLVVIRRRRSQTSNP